MSKVNSGHKAVQTGRQTNACLLGGRKAVYRADTRMLCKGCVKQTALTPIDSLDPERPRDCAEGYVQKLT